MTEAVQTVDEILDEAFAAAAKAADDMIKANPEQWYPCGFAWVRIKPARGPFVKALKARGEGRTDEFEGGYVVYNPSHNHTQWMDAKQAGARAFADILKKHGVKAYAQTRID